VNSDTTARAHLCPHLYHATSMPFIILIILLSSSYLLPSAYSQELIYISALSEFGTKETSLSSPEGVAVDQAGNVYVADTANNRIKKFSSDGTYLIEWGIYGRGNGSLNSPRGVAIDQTGNVYVADAGNNRIQVFSSDGTFVTKWGRYGGPSSNGTLKSAEDIAVDPSSGNVYVADAGNNRIQVFSSDGTFLTEVGAYGRFEEGFRSPEDIAVDPSSGNVYVADTDNNRISVFTPRSPFGGMAFSSEEQEIFGNGATEEMETTEEMTFFRNF
jgi:DNA-binding beta-propeller fold protein YncE